MIKEINDTNPPSTAPQAISTTVTNIGQFLIVAKLVKSYVA